MKKLFGRDKANKVIKVTPGTPTTELDGHQYVSNTAHHYDKPRLGTGYNSDDHWDIIPDADQQTYGLRAGLPPSQSPALSALTTPSPLPTPALLSNITPFNLGIAPAAPQTKSQQQKDRDRDPHTLRKKAPNESKGFTAVGILKALDPHSHSDSANTREPSEDGISLTEHSSREEKKERRNFWERASGKDKSKESERDRDRDRERERDKDKDKDKERDKDRDKDRDRERTREKERKDDDAHGELTKMIGYLTATASEDWSLVLEVCERASVNEANAKEAAKALRKEFKYADAAAQLSAARLWAIMLRNSSEVFIWQCTSRKFLDTLEDLLTSSRTSPVVRERLLEVLAAAAYASSQTRDNGFRILWRRVKPTDKPEEGIPFATDDAMFEPPARKISSPLSPRPAAIPGIVEQPPTPAGQPGQRPPPTVMATKPKSSSRTRVIPPEEDMRRLLQECKIGRGNASLLSEALAFAKPEDLKEKEVIREFYARCRASQELIFAQIPWASAGAERSRLAAGRGKINLKESRPSIDSNRSISGTKMDNDRESNRLTAEEQLLAALLGANEELLEALRLYDDLERVGIERDTEERSRKETRMDRSRLRYDEMDNSFYLGPGHQAYGAAASSSRSPSPSLSPSPSPAPSFVITPVVPPITHPLPAIPTHAPGQYHSPVTSPLPNQSLAPPPPAPHGPRSPGHAQPRSRTPSPERHVLIPDRPGSNELEPFEIGEHGFVSVGENDYPPVRLSAKALGKRKVVEPLEPERSFDPDDLFFEHYDDGGMRTNDDAFDSDSEDGRHNLWHQPVHYVYDAAAERAKERLKQAHATAALVDSVH